MPHSIFVSGSPPRHRPEISTDDLAVYRYEWKYRRWVVIIHKPTGIIAYASRNDDTLWKVIETQARKRLWRMIVGETWRTQTNHTSSFVEHGSDRRVVDSDRVEDF